MQRVIETLPMQNRRDPEMTVTRWFPEVHWYVPERRSGSEGTSCRRDGTSCFGVSRECLNTGYAHKEIGFTLRSEPLLFGSIRIYRKADNALELACDTPLTFNL